MKKEQLKRGKQIESEIEKMEKDIKALTRFVNSNQSFANASIHLKVRCKDLHGDWVDSHPGTTYGSSTDLQDELNEELIECLERIYKIYQRHIIKLLQEFEEL